MIYVGCDYSITSPAVTIIDGSSVEHYFRFDLPKRKILSFPDSFKFKPIVDKDDAMRRYNENSDWVLECIGGREATVVIEGYAMGVSGTGRVFDLAENCGILKFKLNQAGIKYYTPTPGQIKKFYTGNGAAKKELMVYTFEKKTSNDLYDIFKWESVKSPMSDIADSHAMALYCKEVVCAV